MGQFTEHRQAVLESAATTPGHVTNDTVSFDCVTHGFTRKMVVTMLGQLVAEGMLGRIKDERSTRYFLTDSGLDALAHGRFDRKLPEFNERKKRKVLK